MIYITEKESKKVSGNTSLFLSFLFHPEIINAIKSCGTAHFDKKTKIWEVPINALSTLLDTLTYYDDIKLTVLKESEEKDHPIIIENEEISWVKTLLNKFNETL